MFHIIRFIAILFLAFQAIACTQTSPSREDFVRQYLQKYPEATLQDIYKGSFQDVFGPAHLLTDRDAVTRYIRHEMDNAKAFEDHDYFPCGWQGNFYQVNLKVIKDGRVPMDVFVDAFMASANGIDTTLTEAFMDDWALLQASVRKEAPQLQGFEEDSTMLSNLLKEGKYVVHHSRKYNQSYQPHYRIIRRDIFEEKILPKLK